MDRLSEPGPVWRDEREPPCAGSVSRTLKPSRTDDRISNEQHAFEFGFEFKRSPSQVDFENLRLIDERLLFADVLLNSVLDPSHLVYDVVYGVHKRLAFR